MPLTLAWSVANGSGAARAARHFTANFVLRLDGLSRSASKVSGIGLTPTVNHRGTFRLPYTIF
jgi:hypothetical protein